MLPKTTFFACYLPKFIFKSSTFFACWLVLTSLNSNQVKCSFLNIYNYLQGTRNEQVAVKKTTYMTVFPFDFCSVISTLNEPYLKTSFLHIG